MINAQEIRDYLSRAVDNARWAGWDTPSGRRGDVTERVRINFYESLRKMESRFNQDEIFDILKQANLLAKTPMEKAVSNLLIEYFKKTRKSVKKTP